MASVLCIAGLDPSGHAGLSADIRALEFLGVNPLPVASVLTVQNSNSFSEFQPVPVDIIKKQITAILEDTEKPNAAKLGILGTAEITSTVAEILSEAEIPIIADPVLGTSTGYSLADEDIMKAYKYDLFPVACLVTPNSHEASVITGIEVTDPESAKIACQHIYDLGPKAVLVKGGHFSSDRGTDILYDGSKFYELKGQKIEGEVRGTGCTLSSLIAGYIALGLEIPEAVKKAKNDFSRVLEMSSQQGKIITFKEPMTKKKAMIWHSLNNAISSILAILPSDLIAEVGNNVAIAIPGADAPEDVCSLDSRLLAKGNRVVTMGTPVFGRKSHIGRVVLAAMFHDSEMRCAMNLKYSDELVKRLDIAEFTIGKFSRAEQPEDSSSMEWGTGKAITDLGYVPDAVYDKGGIGKEPMIRLLARNLPELIDKLNRVVEARE